MTFPEDERWSFSNVWLASCAVAGLVGACMAGCDIAADQGMTHDEWTITTTMTAGGSQTYTWSSVEAPTFAVAGNRYVETAWQFVDVETGDEITVPVDKTIITKRRVIDGRARE